MIGCSEAVISAARHVRFLQVRPLNKRERIEPFALSLPPPAATSHASDSGNGTSGYSGAAFRAPQLYAA